MSAGRPSLPYTGCCRTSNGREAQSFGKAVSEQVNRRGCGCESARMCGAYRTINVCALGTNSISQTFPAASFGGDLLVVTVKWGNQALSISKVYDNQGNVYNSVLGRTNWTKTLSSAQTLCAKNIVGGGAPITITVTLTGSSSPAPPRTRSPRFGLCARWRSEDTRSELLSRSSFPAIYGEREGHESGFPGLPS